MFWKYMVLYEIYSKVSKLEPKGALIAHLSTISASVTLDFLANQKAWLPY